MAVLKKSYGTFDIYPVTAKDFYSVFNIVRCDKTGFKIMDGIRIIKTGKIIIYPENNFFDFLIDKPPFSFVDLF
ncbi:hypothetical protein ES705_50371 [subsurface metagenome]